MPWEFLNTGKMTPIVDFYGRNIRYSGVEFAGSPREVFWSNFIEPFLEDLFIWAFDFALCHAKKRNLDQKESILYARECLINGLHLTYGRMQKIDRVLRGKGYPDRIPLRDISKEISVMQVKLDKYRDSTLAAPTINNRRISCSSLVDAVDLKPGAFGFAFDLKKFWKWFKSKINYSRTT